MRAVSNKSCAYRSPMVSADTHAAIIVTTTGLASHSVTATRKMPVGVTTRESGPGRAPGIPP